MSARKKPTFVHFLDLTRSDINCDLQVHTTRTDGQADIKTLLDRAVQQGLGRIAFTEHVRKETDWFENFASEVKAQRKAYPQLKALIGCEAKGLDGQGSLDVSEKILAQCDIVLGSVHRFPNGRGGYFDFATLSQTQVEQIELELALSLLQAAPIDVLSHPGGMYMRRYVDFPSNMLREILRKSLNRGIAVEINSSYLRDLPAFLQLCAEINPYVSIGSDVHSLEQLGTCRDQLLAHGIGCV